MNFRNRFSTRRSGDKDKKQNRKQRGHSKQPLLQLTSAEIVFQLDRYGNNMNEFVAPTHPEGTNIYVEHPSAFQEERSKRLSSSVFNVFGNLLGRSDELVPQPICHNNERCTRISDAEHRKQFAHPLLADATAASSSSLQSSASSITQQSMSSSSSTIAPGVASIVATSSNNTFLQNAGVTEEEPYFLEEESKNGTNHAPSSATGTGVSITGPTSVATIEPSPATPRTSFASQFNANLLNSVDSQMVLLQQLIHDLDKSQLEKLV
jgi:hypothetical protein